ncbi:MAG: FixH family protein [Fidelibacterota bacterium]
MNWTQRYKWGIIILILVFLAFNAWLINMSFSQDISLVDDNYYEKDLAYQGIIEELQRTQVLNETIRVTLDKDNIQVILPQDWITDLQSGTIRFYRPSDAKMDRQWPLSPDAEGLQNIPADGLRAGRWIVKIRWLMNDQWYRMEQVLML